MFIYVSISFLHNYTEYQRKYSHLPELIFWEHVRCTNKTGVRFLAQYGTYCVAPSTNDNTVTFWRSVCIISFVTLEHYINIFRSLCRKLEIVVRNDVVAFQELLTCLISVLAAVSVLSYSCICFNRSVEAFTWCFLFNILK